MKLLLLSFIYFVSLFTPDVVAQDCISGTVRLYTECVTQQCPLVDEICHGLSEDADNCNDVEEACQKITNECCPECGEQLDSLLECVTGGNCGFDCGKGETADDPLDDPTTEPEACISDTVGSYLECVAERCPLVDEICHGLPNDADTCADVEEACQKITNECCPECGEQLDGMFECVTGSNCGFDCEGKDAMDGSDPTDGEPEPEACIAETVALFLGCVAERCPLVDEICHGLSEDADNCNDVEEACQKITSECCPECGEQLDGMLECVTGANCGFDCEGKDAIDDSDPTEAVTDPPTSEADTDPPDSDVATTDAPTSEATTDPPDSDATTDPPTSEADTDPPTNEADTDPPTTEGTDPPTSEATTDPPTSEADTDPPEVPSPADSASVKSVGVAILLVVGGALAVL